MSTPTRPDDARALLRDSQVHLDRARERLDASPPAYAEALDAVLASVRASLLAHRAWYGAVPAPEDSVEGPNARPAGTGPPY